MADTPMWCRQLSMLVACVRTPLYPTSSAFTLLFLVNKKHPFYTVVHAYYYTLLIQGQDAEHYSTPGREHRGLLGRQPAGGWWQQLAAGAPPSGCQPYQGDKHVLADSRQSVLGKIISIVYRLFSKWSMNTLLTGRPEIQCIDYVHCTLAEWAPEGGQTGGVWCRHAGRRRGVNDPWFPVRIFIIVCNDLLTTDNLWHSAY